jgi:hypothetical protein
MAQTYEPCGAPTLKGDPCKIARVSCTIHRRAGHDRTPPLRRPQLPGTWGGRAGEADRGHGVRALAIPAAVGEHNVREFAWWMIARLLSAELDAQRAGVLATLLRVIAALGPEPASRQKAFAEAALRGRMMHGMPPRNAAEWELAESIFSQEVLDEFAHYAELLREANGRDVGKPFGFGERAAGKSDVALVVDAEDRG